jgi:thiol:disulfide interchange protein
MTSFLPMMLPSWWRIFTRKDPAIAAELARHQRAGVPMYLWYPAGSDEPQVLPEILNQRLVTSLPVNP